MRILLLLMVIGFSGAAKAEPVELPGPAGLVLKANLVLPKGPIMAPAIVALHGCGGAFGARDRQWTEILSGAGHILLFPDSFGSRGLGSQCRERNRVASSDGLRRADALASARWLAARPETPPGGVVLLGWSDGGSTVLASARAAPDVEPGLLRGSIAFYPGCRGASVSPSWKPGVPMLILMGEADDWTPAAPCHVLAERVGTPLTLVTYPGAYHDFDAPVPLRIMQNIPSSQNLDHSVHVGGNPEARGLAISRVLGFVASLPAIRPP